MTCRQSARDRQFWQRFVAACGAGYVCFMSGFVLAYAVFTIATIIVGNRPGDVFLAIGMVTMAFPYFTVLLFLSPFVVSSGPLMMMLPVILLSALMLRTGKWGTLIFGAAVGGLSRVPALLGGSQDDVQGWVTPVASAVGGMMFALALWHFCLRHYNTPGILPVLGPPLPSLPLPGPGAKVAIIVSAGALAFFCM